MTATRPHLVTYAAVLAVVLFFLMRGPAFLNGQATFGILTCDSEEYLAISRHLIDGTYFNGPISDGCGTADYRSIGYPLLLLPAALLGEGHAILALFFTYFFLSWGIFLFVSYAFRSVISPWICGALLIISALLVSPYTLSIMSEWPAFLAVLLLVAAFYNQLCRPSSKNILTLSLSIAGLLLLRPAMAPYLLIIAFVPLRSLRTSERMALVAGFLPLVLAIGINLERLGVPTLSMGLAPNLLGVASLIAQQEVPLSEDSLQRQFNNEFQKRIITPREGHSSDVLGTNNEALNVLLTNQWQALLVCREQGISIVPCNKLMQRYAVAAIASHLNSYMRNLLKSQSALLYALPLFLIALFALRRGSARVQSTEGRALRRLFISIGILHAVYLLFIAAVSVLEFRYWAVSFAPLIFVTLVTYVAFIFSAKEIGTRFTIEK